MSISFNGSTKVITLSTGTITLSARDIWSRWVDWFLTGDNSKYLPAFQQVGGDDIDEGAGTKIPIYVFLLNGWKVQPQMANHTLSVGDGILLVFGGGDPFNDCEEHSVRINYQQPVQAISFDSGGSGGLTGEEHTQLMSLTDIGGEGTPVTSIPTDYSSLAEKLNWLVQYFKCKREITQTQEKLYASDGETVIGTVQITKDATKFIKDEMV